MIKIVIHVLKEFVLNVLLAYIDYKIHLYVLVKKVIMTKNLQLKIALNVHKHVLYVKHLRNVLSVEILILESLINQI